MSVSRLAIEEVAKEFEVPSAFLYGDGRRASGTIALARQAAHWILRFVWQPPHSFAEIGAMLFFDRAVVQDGAHRISLEIHEGSAIGRRVLAVAERLASLDADYFAMPKIDVELMRVQSEMYLKKNQQKRAHNARKKASNG